LLIIISVFLTLAVSEAALRLLSHKDIDGNIYIGKLRVRPFFLPVNKLQVKYQQFLEKDQPYGRYDPELGWSVRPSSRSENGVYASNDAGIRTATVDQKISLEPAPGILRIALFGDSFTHGDDVPFEFTWGAILEKRLNQQGIKAEVLNLGGQGYAMDQALLRWRKNGKPLKPHLVMFGFQNTNIKRNLNIIRMFYSPDTGVIFSKPRFILTQGNHLRLLNSPTLPPEKIFNIYSDFHQWPLRPYEIFYEEDDYRWSPWYQSRLAAFVISGLTNRFSSRRRDFNFFAEASESRQLTEKIIENFEQDVVAAQARFLIVHLPTKNPLEDLLQDDPLEYQDLLDELRGKYDLIDPTPELIRQAEEGSYEALFAKDSSHYSPLANRVIGEWIATSLPDAKFVKILLRKNFSGFLENDNVLNSQKTNKILASLEKTKI
jgi:hypothetical protein